MNRTILAGSLLALVVAACAKEQPVPAAHGAQASDTTAMVPATGPDEGCVQDGFYSPLPDPAIRFQFPFRIARDRVYDGTDGKLRRGVSIEYLEGSADDVWGKVVASMAAAGFEHASGPGDQNEGTFLKEGQPGIFAKVDGNPGTNPTGNDVKGSVWLSWNSNDKKATAAP